MSDPPRPGFFELSRQDVPAAAAFLALYLVTAGAVRAVGTPTVPPLLPSLLLAVALSLLSAIDLRSYRLPDALTLPLIAAGLVVTALADVRLLWWHALSAVIGFALLAAVAAVYQRVRNRPGLGLGDAKLLAASGAWLGAELLPDVLLWASGAAVLCVLVSALRGHSPSAEDAIPFGPFLAFGTWALWLYGPA